MSELSSSSPTPKELQETLLDRKDCLPPDSDSQVVDNNAKMMSQPQFNSVNVSLTKVYSVFLFL